MRARLGTVCVHRHSRVQPEFVAEHYRHRTAGPFPPCASSSLIHDPAQDPVLFTGTIASNIAFGNATATRDEIEHAARLANCEFVWGMPKGFDTESACLHPSW